MFPGQAEITGEQTALGQLRAKTKSSLVLFHTVIRDPHGTWVGPSAVAGDAWPQACTPGHEDTVPGHL